ncbi:prepilin-type N-terminal cleavage/methylation domain-containing protein [Pelomonas sp. SE-A7]|uniref:PulJ/GspJ family protein n=1 Tax=Pelomonas sp. SE-A7 TaxID=3054953 RepID=UPI00259CF015|nr:prepilin-type N-terminal cleavage/methylation domain-containing protein [Pelomonas sp. SE-A7]MDM4766425.1 prepilin-type N-terminal cleavage/methylation domain-containing protein [Pelomonas sp. SE-A7]
MSARRLHGFTLIEVLIALVIMAVMAGMAWRGLDAVLRSREISQAHLDRTTRLQTVLAQWEQDLRLLQDSQLVPALAFDGASLRLTRATEQGLQVVVWTVRNGELDRWATPPVTTQDALTQAYERSLQPLSLAEGSVRTLQGLQEWQVYFYRGSAWSHAQSSDDVQQPAAPAQPPSQPAPGVPQRKKLPNGVRIVLSFLPDSGYGGPVTRQLQLGPQQQ